MALAGERLFVPWLDLATQHERDIVQRDRPPARRPRRAQRPRRRHRQACSGSTGCRRWSFGAATVANDVVFTSTYDGTIYAFATATGKQLWTAKARAGINSFPAIAGDMLLVGAAAPGFFEHPRFELIAYALELIGARRRGRAVEERIDGRVERQVRRRHGDVRVTGVVGGLEQLAVLANEGAQPERAGAGTRPRGPRPRPASPHCRAAAGRAPPRSAEATVPHLRCERSTRLPGEVAFRDRRMPREAYRSASPVRGTSKRPTALGPRRRSPRAASGAWSGPPRRRRHEHDAGRDDVRDVQRVDVGDPERRERRFGGAARGRSSGTRPLTIAPSTAMPRTMPTLRAELASPAATPAWSRGMLATATVLTGSAQHGVARSRPRGTQPAASRSPHSRPAAPASRHRLPSTSMPPTSTPRGPRVPTR